MSAETSRDQQTRDRTSADANIEKTPSGDASAVTADANTAMLEQMKELFASAQKRSDEQEKLMSSLAKQVRTLTAKSKPPRGATRVRRGRRLDFGSPGNQDKDAPRESTEQNPDETAPAGQKTTSDNLPPPRRGKRRRRHRTNQPGHQRSIGSF